MAAAGQGHWHQLGSAAAPAAGDAHAGPGKPFWADSAPARGGHAAQLQLKALAAAFGTTAAAGGLDAPGGPPKKQPSEASPSPQERRARRGAG